MIDRVERYGEVSRLVVIHGGASLTMPERSNRRSILHLRRASYNSHIREGLPQRS